MWIIINARGIFSRKDCYGNVVAYEIKPAATYQHLEAYAGHPLKRQVKIHLVHPYQEGDEEDQAYHGLYKTTPLFTITRITHTVVFSKIAQQRNVKNCGCATRFLVCCFKSNGSSDKSLARNWIAKYIINYCNV